MPLYYRLESQQISNCDNLLYSEYFYSFLSSEEHNEAVSHIKLSRYDEAHPLLEVSGMRYFPFEHHLILLHALQAIFVVREKLLTISNVHVLQCLCELVATLHAVGKLERAYSYALVAKESFALVKVI